MDRYANGRAIALETETRWINEREFAAIYKIAFRELLRAYEYKRLSEGWTAFITPNPEDYPKLERQAQWFAVNLGTPSITPSCGLISRVVPGEQLDLPFVASLAAWWANLEPALRNEFQEDVGRHACQRWVPPAMGQARSIYYTFMRADPAYQSLDWAEASPVDPYNPLSAKDVGGELARVQADLNDWGFAGTQPASAVPAPPPYDPPVGMADPSWEYCAQQGGKPVSVPGTGGEHGVCVFPDGTQCNTWDLYHGDCKPPATPAKATSRPKSPALVIAGWAAVTVVGLGVVAFVTRG
jgi:hypothetical protein